VRTLAGLLERAGGAVRAEALADAPPEDLAEIFVTFGVTDAIAKVNIRAELKALRGGGAPSAEGSKFCGECGAPMTGTSTFCTGCSVPRLAPPKPAPQARLESPPPFTAPIPDANTVSVAQGNPLAAGSPNELLIHSSAQGPQSKPWYTSPGSTTWLVALAMGAAFCVVLYFVVLSPHAVSVPPPPKTPCCTSGDSCGTAGCYSCYNSAGCCDTTSTKDCGGVSDGYCAIAYCDAHGHARWEAGCDRSC
jgi:hypothetical protein